MSNPEQLSRRAFLVGTAAAAASVADGLAPEDAKPSATAPLTALSACDAVQSMVRGELTAERYAGALLAKCESQRALNAFITLEPERVLEHARACDQQRRTGAKLGPLFGLPIPVKDSVNTRDYATTGGTPALRHFRPEQDAPVVASLKGAGAIVLGKTNLHELSFGWTTNNLAFGAVHNPYDYKRIPGGSSGGTAAAIAARLAPLGVAEDTEGSIRVPAAFCGIAGFRPTTRRYSTKGCVPISPLFDQVGPHARTVQDLALFDSVVAGDPSPLSATPLRGIRLGVVRDYWFADLDPEVERIAGEALARLRDAGAVLVEGKIPGLAHLIDLTTNPVQNHDVRPELARYLKDYGARLSVEELIAHASPDIREIFRTDVMPGGVNVVSEAAYAAARDQHLPALRRLFQEYFSRTQVAAIVFPATLVPPPLIGEETTLKAGGGRSLPFEVAVARNIAPGSTAGLPGLVLPAGLNSSGLPVALEFDAPVGSDRALLALGLSLEHALGGIAPPKGSS
ncbi:MAG: indoleacetamide hydrolase [Gammaproteobacteria bacterium]|jgi:mandelamide amidase|nr:indoleacetamide hydrolase [Gammaproteobacteria bacterium]